MPRALVGLTGAAGCGKNTVAEILLDRGFVHFGFADPVYRGVAAILGVPESSLRDRSAKETPIGWLGKSPRELLQTLGTEWGRDTIADDIWIRIALRQAEEIRRHANCCITDVRFENEAEAIRAAGGKIWLIQRSQRCLSDAAAAHSSESGIPPHLIDRVIDNDGTIADLRELVLVE